MLSLGQYNPQNQSEHTALDLKSSGELSLNYKEMSQGSTGEILSISSENANVLKINDDMSGLPSELREPITNGTLQTSIEKKIELEKEIHLTPNPTTSKVNILGVAASDISTVEIYDSKGIIVQYEKEVRNGQLNVENLQPGTYYCKIKAKGLTITKKFIKL